MNINFKDLSISVLLSITIGILYWLYIDSYPYTTSAITAVGTVISIILSMMSIKLLWVMNDYKQIRNSELIATLVKFKIIDKVISHLFIIYISSLTLIVVCMLNSNGVYDNNILTVMLIAFNILFFQKTFKATLSILTKVQRS